MKPRYYQADALSNTIRNIECGKPDNLIVIPVGGGKSVVIAHNALYALKRHPDSRVILVSHRKELSTQNAEKLATCDPTVSIGFEKGSEICAPENQVMVASVQTIGKEGLERVKRWTALKNVRALLIDEGHHIPGGKTYQILLEELRAANPDLIVTAFTATPKRGDGERIDAYIKHISYEVSMQELIDAKYLARLKGIRVNTDTSMKNMQGTKRKDFDDSELDKIVNNEKRNQLAVEVYLAKHHATSDRGLAFCVSKDHAKQVCSLFLQAGIKAACITEETPPKERDQIIFDYKKGIIHLLTSVGVLSEGFDCPHVKVLLMLRPTKSPVLYEQLLGRGLRLVAYPDPADKDAEWIINWEEKTYCTAYDFVDQDAIEAGALNLARMVGLNPDFDFGGKDLFEVKKTIDEQCEGEPLLAAALQACRTPAEIEALLQSHDILSEIQAIRYTPNQELGWMEIREEEHWIQLGQGEIAIIKKDALGEYILEMPNIDLKVRYESRKEWEKANPDRVTKPAEAPKVNNLEAQTYPLESDSMEAALKEASHMITSLVPSDYHLLAQNTQWKEAAKNIPATEAQKNQVRWMKLGIEEVRIGELTKAEASDLISKAKLQKTLMQSQGRITFGKYKNVPVQLVAVHNRRYLAWMMETRADFLEKQGLIEHVRSALNDNPLPWLKNYRPLIYRKDFAEMEDFYEDAFSKDPRDVNAVVKFALEQDPGNQWPLIEKKAEAEKSSKSS